MFKGSIEEIDVKTGYLEILRGAKGEPGKDGRDGRNGKDGIDGRNGRDGIDGKDGKDGKDGATPDLTNYYTKEETDLIVSNIDIPEVDLTEYPNKEEMNNAIEHDVNKVIKIGGNSALTGSFRLTTEQLEPLRYYFENNIKGNVLLNVTSQSSSHSWLVWVSTNATLVEGSNKINNCPMMKINSSTITLGSSNLTVTVSDGVITDMELLFAGTTYSGNLSSYVKSSDVLKKTNTSSYTPTSDYHPATKLYVDNAINALRTELGI